MYAVAPLAEDMLVVFPCGLCGAPIPGPFCRVGAAVIDDVVKSEGEDTATARVDATVSDTG